jgi:asparagine synthase (glutamine-hydrolysing)
MALSGLGGDELFAGYDIFRRADWLQRKRWIWQMPAFARRISGSMLKTLWPGISSEKIASLLSLPAVDPAQAVMTARRVLTGDQVAQITNGWRSKSILPGDKMISRQKRLELPKNDFLLSAVSIAEIETYMQNVLLRDTDQMSMAHALEVRVPFLDYQLVEYVLNLPDRYKFPHTPKKLLVDALGTRLPREIVDRPKMGFTFPWKNWMKNELRGFCEERLKQLGKRKPFSENGLMQLWNSFLTDDPRVSWSRIWPLVVLAHWLDKNGIDE